MVDTVTPAWKERKITQIFHLENEGREKVQIYQKSFLQLLV